MNQFASTLSQVPLRQPPSWAQSLPFYFGWINVLVASVAMTATLPGRTHGLGLITEPLLADLGLDQVLFARLNLVSSLLGALFALPVGWLIDRYGVRSVLPAVTALLSVSVLGMSQVQGAAMLLVALTLVRGLGQSALSVASMAAIGKWFSRRLGTAMGAFAVLLTFGFIASVLAMGEAIRTLGWRGAWQTLGWSLLALAPIFWLVVRSTPEACGIAPDESATPDEPAGPGASTRSIQPTAALAARPSLTLRRALTTPAFWFVVLGSSAFNLVWSGVTLFNESMIVERGLDQKIAVQIMAILTGTGLLANLVCGALARRDRVLKLLAVGLVMLAAALVIFPSIATAGRAQLYAAAIGLSGGVITVVFFAAWGHLFGQLQLGRIQGVAQFATVLASALGPVIFAEGRALHGSYGPTCLLLAVLCAALGVAALFSSLPREA